MKDDETRLPVAAEASIDTPEVDPGAGTLTQADQIAAAIIAIFDRLEERLPDVRRPDPVLAMAARGARTVRPEFVSSLIDMVDASPGLQAARTIDRDKAVAVLEARDPYRRIAERVARFLETVNYTREAQWAEIATAAMATYRTADIMALDPSNRYLIPHLKILRRHLGRRRGKKKDESE